ncbi:hypothetical protein LCGC14_1226030 [marine sediment metagenome]|uniref:Uncharacterized protein n=1 Tax=marine sediment metagenome TaxID=412755 RepID=A0A0F9LDV6_9ZZZZ
MTQPRQRIDNPSLSGIENQGLGQYLQDIADVLNEPEVEVREFIQLSAATTISPQATTVYLFNASEATTITLPRARAVRNFHYYIKNLSLNTLTLATQAGETIDNVSSFALLQLDAVRLTSNSTNHWIL